MIFSYRSGLICISAGCHLLNMVVMMLHNIHRFVNVLANALEECSLILDYGALFSGVR